MTIAFTRLFTTQGLYAGALNETNTWRGTLATRAATLNTQLITSTVYNALYSGTFTNRDAAKKAEDSYIGSLASAALSTLLAEVEADRPGTGTSLDSAVTELRRQMILGSQTLNDCPGAVAVTDVGTPVGDPQLVFGLYEPKTGLKADFFVPDTLLATCTADRSQSGTAHAESFSLIGKTADSLPTDASYPSGSGINTTFTLIDPASDESVVSNGAFQTFTVTNTPDDWTLSAGTLAGTHVFKKTSDDPRGTDVTNISLRLVGDGSQIIKLRQTLTLLPNTAYTIHFRAKKITDAGTDWGVTARLVDAVAFTAVAGNGAYANSVSTVTCGSMSANWANVVTGVFLTPAVIPTNGIALEIALTKFGDLTTAAIATSEVYVDYVSMIETEALYAGGPTLTAFSGLLECVVGDTKQAAVTLVSGVPSTYLIRQMDRLLGLASLTDRIPTVAGGGETQADALVV